MMSSANFALESIMFLCLGTVLGSNDQRTCISLLNLQSAFRDGGLQIHYYAGKKQLEYLSAQE